MRGVATSLLTLFLTRKWIGAFGRVCKSGLKCEARVIEVWVHVSLLAAITRNDISTENTNSVHLHLHAALQCTNCDARGFETIVNKNERLYARNYYKGRIFEKA